MDARAEEGGFSDLRGPYFCLRSIACRDHCPTKYDDHCSFACKSSLTLCQAYRTKNKLVFRAALVGWASARSLREHEKQDRILEARPITRVGALLEECESRQPSEREECVNLVGAWGSMMIRNGRQWRTGMKERRPGAACATIPIADADFAQAFIEWAKTHPSERDLDVNAGLDAAIATAWPCSKPDAE
ncbi:hypothetical protein [Bradyrhizobium sp. STM 3562]|uniref:hypothetical protein n=1 Tax=Bradyrhizobium sp. STM 3562 TaxID=578924 RepID=UPI00388D2E6C